MQLDEELSFLLHGGQVMDGHAHALSSGANGFEEMLALRRARLGMDHHVGGNDFADPFFDGVAESVNLFEAGGARDADGGIDEVAIAGAAHAHAVHVENAIHAGDSAGDLLLQPLRGDVQQGVESAPAEARADPEDYGGDRQPSESIGIVQPGHVPGVTGPNKPDANDDDDGAP